MKFLIFALFLIGTLYVTNAYSQLGRYEQPIDTMSIGGEEQDDKMMQMERQDELLSTLAGLRDSVSAAIKSRPQKSLERFVDHQEKIDQLIKEFAATERDVTLMKKAEVLIREARQTLREAHEN